MEAAGGIYAETMVWELVDNAQRRRFVGQGEASQGSISTHQRIVARIHETGQCEATDEG